MATHLEAWVEEQAKLAQPDRIHWCDGSEEEARKIIETGMKEENINGNPIFYELDHQKWPHAYLHRSHPTDVARTEQLTFICHPDQETSGPNNNWMAPAEAKAKMTKLSEGCMRGKTMYVMPYMMGHPDSPYAKACVQVTDISYVAVSMRIMTHMSKSVLDKIGNSENFVKGFHSVRDFDPEKRFIMHFPEENMVWSVGSGYGGNALLGKKCVALRIASCQGYKENWMAEHMLVMGIEDPQGKVTYVAAAFPSACGKTNLAMMQSALPGYKIWTVGDDIAWLNIGPDGRLWAINPEAGCFGVAPGTSMNTNPSMMKTLLKDGFYPTLYTNVAHDLDHNAPWWEGLDSPAPTNALDWQGHPWKAGAETKGAHPNSRFTVSIYNCPTLSPEYDNPKGVPISAIIFGGKRSSLIPLVMESFDWAHGVFLGARIGSEMTAAQAGKVGTLRRDPMAMLPFCGYNMGDYFGHWLKMGGLLKHPPKIFSVNWFRKDKQGHFMWPGFGDNVRILEWMIKRINGQAEARETPIGLLPYAKDINIDGAGVGKEQLDELFNVQMKDWKDEADGITEYLKKFGTHMPEAITKQAETLRNATK